MRVQFRQMVGADGHIIGAEGFLDVADHFAGFHVSGVADTPVLKRNMEESRPASRREPANLGDDALDLVRPVVAL